MENRKLFLGVGTQSAGNLLLYKILDECSQIDMHPATELHYFDTLYKIRDNDILKDFAKKQFEYENGKFYNEYNQTFFNNRHKALLRSYNLLAFNDIEDLDYFDLFKPLESSKIGEISPEYFLLNKNQIEKMREVIGKKSKIIILVRDPIKRFIESAKLILGENINIDSIKKIIKTQNRFNNYKETIENYKNSFNEVLVLSYEEFFLDKNKNLEKIENFIEETLNREKYYTLIDSFKENEFIIDKELEYFLIKEYENRYIELEELFKDRYKLSKIVSPIEKKVSFIRATQLFDNKFYKELYLEDENIEPIEHFIYFNENNPNILFDIDWYKKSYGIEEEPFTHFIKEGINKNYLPSEYYLKNELSLISYQKFIREDKRTYGHIKKFSTYKGRTFIDIILIGDKKRPFYLKVDNQLIKQIFFKEDNKLKDCYYAVEIPNRYVKKGEIKIDIISDNQSIFYFPIKVNYSPDYDFFVEKIDRKEIKGWVIDKKAFGRVLKVEIYINKNYIDYIIADEKEENIYKNYNIEHSNFEFEFEKPLNYKELTIELKIKGEDKSFYKTTLFDKTSFLETLFLVQNFLKESSSNSSQVFRENIFYDLLKESREDFNSNNLSLSYKKSYKLKEHNFSYKNGVDVIIPIYKNAKVTKNCIESVLNAKNETPFYIYLINDKSPDFDMQDMLKEYSNHHKIILIENQENLGFVKSVNIGMKKGTIDVILLNSDTIVTDNWIDKLHKTAYSNKTIATVTPFSNRATIFSYPETLVDNEIPKDFTTNELNSLVEEANRDLIIDVPTAHGFCLYIKRDALDEIGYFNENKYGKGYGEENDFSMRALSLGWRNVASCNTFIEHLGSVSFSKNRDAFVENNLKILNSDYPEYSLLIERFIEEDPLKEARRNISLKIYQKIASSYRLFIAHSLGGGTQKAINSIIKNLKEEQEALILYLKNGIYRVENRDYPFRLEYKKDEFNLLIEDLKHLNIETIEYHHLIDFGWNGLEISKKLNIPYNVTIHDYMPLCPRINLINQNNLFCEVAKTKQCINCIDKSGVYENLEKMYEEVKDVKEWRDRFEIFLKEAKNIFIPDKSVKEYLDKAFILDNVSLKPHPEKEELIKIKLDNKKVNQLAIIGAIGTNKGFYQLLEIIHNAYIRDLNLNFILIGFSQNDNAFSSYPNITITEKYKEEELPTILKEHNCSIALFLSIWPETFSYTLSEALQNKLYPIAYDIGAFSNRLKELDIGTLIPIDSSSQEINNTILKVFQRNIEKEVKIGKEYKPFLNEYYNL